MKYEWNIYNIEDEIVGGGIIYADCYEDAKAKVEKDIDENNDEYTEAGYFRYEINGGD